MDNLNIKTFHMCRTCMEEIINISFFNLDFAQVDSEPTIGQKLSACIPELDLSIVPNAVICGKCADTINSLYIFREECLQLEMQIREYIQQVQHTDNAIDLAAVMQFRQLCSKNLTVELKMEAFEKIENYKNEESPTSFSESYAFNETEGNAEIAAGDNQKTENYNEEYPTSLSRSYAWNTEIATGDNQKTDNYKNEDATTSFCDNYTFNETARYAEVANREYLTSPEMVERHCVLFNTFENFINSGKSETEDNSDMHDTSNIVQDCLLQVIENPDSCIQNLNRIGIYYQCFTCGHKAESKLKLIRHLKDNKWCQNKIPSKSHKILRCWYRCDLCNYSTKYKYLFSFHNRTHLTKKDYCRILKSNPIPVQSSNNTITFDKHDFKYWSKFLSKCSKSKQHSNQLKMETNIVVKTLKCLPPFKCPICEYSSNHKSALKYHMLTHTGVKPFKCPVCEHCFNQKSNLKMHLLTHTGEKPFKCPICEYSCNRKDGLRSHMLTHTTGEKPFKCSVCEYSCNYKSDLKHHMLTHTGEKPFMCSVCEHSFTKKNNLKMHFLTHTGERPFKCSVCLYSCNHKQNLKRHMLIHTGEKPFKCSVCEYSCRHKPHLKSHMLTHTGEKPFKCSVCEYCSTTRYLLKIHMQNHL